MKLFRVFSIKFQVFFVKFQVFLLNSTYHEIREFTYLCPRGLALKNSFLTNFNFNFFSFRKTLLFRSWLLELCHKIGTLSIFSFFSIPKCSISLRELLLNTARCFVSCDHYMQKSLWDFGKCKIFSCLRL